MKSLLFRSCLVIVAILSLQGCARFIYDARRVNLKFIYTSLYSACSGKYEAGICSNFSSCAYDTMLHDEDTEYSALNIYAKLEPNSFNKIFLRKMFDTSEQEKLRLRKLSSGSEGTGEKDFNVRLGKAKTSFIENSQQCAAKYDVVISRILK